jgi:hypothetical protein
MRPTCAASMEEKTRFGPSWVDQGESRTQGALDGDQRSRAAWLQRNGREKSNQKCCRRTAMMTPGRTRVAASKQVGVTD